ncbi:hypothetical protein TWF694_003765 [Orbilia ellipsospora]|uniref:Uncharacterized protein n=1 Tax=Orbilia ellipsospora TaxID=2528407 RepID=A0AAV9X557_9PEZI
MKHLDTTSLLPYNFIRNLILPKRPVTIHSYPPPQASELPPSAIATSAEEPPLERPSLILSNKDSRRISRMKKLSWCDNDVSPVLIREGHWKIDM